MRIETYTDLVFFTQKLAEQNIEIPDNLAISLTREEQNDIVAGITGKPGECKLNVLTTNYGIIKVVTE